MKELLAILVSIILFSCSGNADKVYTTDDAGDKAEVLDKAFYDFNTEPHLQKERYRDYTPVKLSEEFKQEIKNNTRGLTAYDIILYCNKKTQDLLTFSTKCEPFDDRKVTKMHCVGYAKVYATICNYAFKINKIAGKAAPVVGYVKWKGINLNNFSKLLPKDMRNFTKDHDFVEVKYEDKVIYADPSLNIINNP